MGIKLGTFDIIGLYINAIINIRLTISEAQTRKHLQANSF